MSSTLKTLQRQAESTIKSNWEDIARTYTAAWMGPVEVVEMHFPHVSGQISGIRSQVSSILPMIIYQSRESPPKSTIIAVPYISGGDPYKCRLVATKQLSPEQMRLLGDFAQAIWFLIDSGVFPHPREGKEFETKLVEWTGEKLTKL